MWGVWDVDTEPVGLKNYIAEYYRQCVGGLFFFGKKIKSTTDQFQFRGSRFGVQGSPLYLLPFVLFHLFSFIRPTSEYCVPCTPVIVLSIHHISLKFLKQPNHKCQFSNADPGKCKPRFS